MAKPVTKAELIADIAERAGLSKAQTSTVFDAVLAAITAQLQTGATVSLPGLAKFEVRERPARQVRNVATGAMIDKAPDRAVKVSALTALKNAVNEAS